MTINGPNSSVPDNALCGTVANTDPLMPCADTSSTTRQNAARSRHLGGVNTTFGDGSVRFLANTVRLQVWQAMGSMDAGDIATE